jgi:succinoglycan biosynthesis protein ExoA
MFLTNAQNGHAGRAVGDLEILVVVPCLNEEAHLGSVLSFLAREIEGLRAEVVVADGGSQDRSREIVTDYAARDPRFRLLANPRRIQSSAINLAVKAHGDGKDYLIRVDAHCGYRPGFIRGLIEAAVAHDACSVVVPMETIGTESFQRAAAAQNSKLGNGGSSHRLAVASRYVDHGHHALMSVAAFRSVGGYDESFTHNEDAELDVRLRKAGGKIWLEGSQIIEYYPRKSASKLLRQYYNYGKGRARNTLKHRTVPKIRQSIPLGVAPAVLLALLSPLWWPLAIPALAWLGICLGYGVVQAVRSGRADDLLIGPALAIMHFGWSAGFFMGIVDHFTNGHAATPAPSLR